MASSRSARLSHRHYSFRMRNPTGRPESFTTLGRDVEGMRWQIGVRLSVRLVFAVEAAIGRIAVRPTSLAQGEVVEPSVWLSNEGGSLVYGVGCGVLQLRHELAPCGHQVER